MKFELSCRPATDADLPSITAIYNHAVQHTTAIWNETLVDESDRRQWLSHRFENKHPVIVAVVGDVVVGYATYGEWRTIQGFRHTKEHSIYIKEEYSGRGIGRLLMEKLENEAVKNNVHVLVACIESGNAASISLHEKMGFRHVGCFHQVGKKFGHWLNLVCMEKILAT